MKKTVCFLLTLVLTLSFAYAAMAADLVIYSARNERLNNIVIPGFEEATGIKVEMITGSTGEVNQRIKAEVESGAVTVDIHWAADETMLDANRDLFQPYVSIHNDAMMPQFKNDGSNAFNPAFAEPNVLIVNTEKLEELGITVEGYEDLIQPELKGKIISADPANSSSAFQCLIGMLYGMGNGDPMSAEAWEFIDKFLVNLDGKVASSSSQVYNGVANGEYYVGLSYEDPCVELEAAGEQPVKVVYAKEGTIFPGQSVQIVKDAPNLEAAQQFVDYVLSEEVQTAVAAELNLRPLRAGIPTNSKMIPNEDITLFETYSAPYIAENKATIVNTYLEHVEMMME
ncbi:MAG: extracellular solute-binding protein [Clostridiales bacterium]|nr:extracellular solute-binding protein [Clostridiales bacterium]